jgi:hypothetical protein
MTIANGISFERDSVNTSAYIKFDYAMYGGLLQNFFQQHNIELPLLPNETTEKAIKQAKNWKKFKKYSSAETLLADCLS